MSDAELAELDSRVKLSGRQKQDYIIKSILHQKIVVIGNQIQLDRLRQTLDEIADELRRIEHAEDVSGELLAPIRTAVEIIDGFGADE
jgi:malonyl CoA-acyl carrier protein transacylase